MQRLRDLREMIEDLRGIVGIEPLGPMAGAKLKSDPTYMQLREFMLGLHDMPAVAGLDATEMRALNTLFVTVMQIEAMEPGTAVAHLKAVWTTEAKTAVAKMPIGPDIERAIETLASQNSAK